MIPSLLNLSYFFFSFYPNKPYTMKANSLFFAGCILACLPFIGCSDDKGEPEDTVEKPVVSLQHPEDITLSSFTVEVNVESDGGSPVTDRGICIGSTPQPTIDDETISGGTGTGAFSVTMENLPSNTLYYIIGYATNEKGTAYSVMQYTAVTAFGTVTDFEGNVYQTVKIGSQEWMRENLKSTKYADGSTIPGAYPAGGLEPNVELYGRLYDWYGVMHGAASSNANPSMVQGVCPGGYHVPSDAEWQELEMYLGMTQFDAEINGYRGNVAGKLKVQRYWIPNDYIGNDSAGFSALPAGYRNLDGSYDFDHFWAGFHISTENIDTSKVASRLLTGDLNGIWREPDSKKYAYSARCVKDE
jgi:uncharacterized protein (TIGR02145 family)